MAGTYSSTQLVDGDGDFNTIGLRNFMETTNMTECGKSYAVVSIMGPQSSGKSTLLNHLFGTKFKEMNAAVGRTQTTKGIWLSRCADIKPFTVVMDLEGTDGTERGEDDTTFEKQSALFALAVSDIVLINMWCHDIGREQGASKPLLRTVFEVMIRLFTRRRTTLLFVIRDKSRTPLEILEGQLKTGIQKIWDSVPKPEARSGTLLNEVFDVKVVALSNYETNEDLFKEEVASLRQRFNNSIEPDGLAGDRHEVTPAEVFAISTQGIWELIKENKDLNLPKYKVMVATVRCEEIVQKIVSSMTTNAEWLELIRVSREEMVPGFGEKLTAILDKCLSGYNKETTYFDEATRSSKREQLVSKLLETAKPAYRSVLSYIRSNTLNDFKEAFDKALVKGKEGFAHAAARYTESYLLEFDKRVNQDAATKHANWDPSKVKRELQRHMDAHVASVRATELEKLTEHYMRKLDDDLKEPVKARLVEANDKIWPAIRDLLQKVIRSRIHQEFSSAVSAFGLDQDTTNKSVELLEKHAKAVVESEARNAAKIVDVLMKDRFKEIFRYDNNSERRVWKKKKEIEATSETARKACLECLSVMAAIRLDDRDDDIWSILSRAFSDNGSRSGDLLSSNTWNDKRVTPNKMLISPIRCKNVWMDFKKKTEHIVKKETDILEAKQRESQALAGNLVSTALSGLGIGSQFGFRLGSGL